MAFKFDGVDDLITFSTLSTAMQNLATGNYTVAAVMSRTTWSRSWDAIFALKSTTTIGTFDPQASAEWQSSTIFTAQDAGNNRNWTHGLGTLSGVPLLVVMTKPTGTAAFQISVLNINTGVWTHGNSSTSGANGVAVPSTGALTFGSFPDLFLGNYGVFAAWSGVAMTQTQRMECGTNLKTSDMANHSAGAPSCLIEFTKASPTDPMGGVESIFTNVAPVLDNTVTLGWTYDSVGGYDGTILNTSGVVAAWDFDETAGVFADKVGALDLTATGTMTRGAAGLFPDSTAAVDLGGASGKANRTAASTSELAAGTGFSVEAWVRPDVGATRMAIYSRGGSTAATEQILFGVEAAGTWEAYISNGSSYLGVSSIGSWTSGNTYHVVMTWNGTTGRLYVNGVDISGAGFSITTPLASPTNVVTWGARGGTTQWWNGVIDGGSFYNRALTATEVSDHYAAGSPAAGVGTFDEAGVTFDSADSQFDFFIAPSGTPISGSDSITLSEAVAIAVSLSPTDSATLSEARTLERQSSVTDSVTLSEASAASAALSASDSAALSEVGAGRLDYGTLQDPFTSLANGTATTNVSIQGGRLEIVPVGAYPNYENFSYPIGTIQGRSLLVEVPQVASGNVPEIDTTFQLGDSPSVLPANGVGMVKEGTLLYFQQRVSSVATNLSSITYDATAHRWWRMSESGGVVSFDTSPDGATWTNRYTLNVSSFLPVGSVYLQLNSGYWNGTYSGTWVNALFDNLGLGPVITPKSASDSATLSESPTLQRQSSVTDNGTLSEAAAAAIAAAAVDSATLSESPSLSAQAAATDSAALSEAVSAAVAAAVADSATLSEARAISAAFSAVDSATLSEAQALSVAQAATDTGTLSEAVAAAITAAVTDSATLSEARAISAALSSVDSAALSELQNAISFDAKVASDSAALSEARSVSAAQSAVDTGTLSEAVAAAITAAAADGLTLSEARSISAALSAADSGTLSEAQALAVAVATLDTITLSEAQTLQAQIARSDSFTLSEAVALAAAVSVTALATLSESAIGGQQADKVASDSATLSESAAALRTNQILASDAFTLGESQILQAQLSQTDSGVLSESVDVLQQILKTAIDSGALSEDTALFVQIGSDYTHSLPPQFVVGEYQADGAIFAAVASGDPTVYGALVVGTNSARLIVFDRTTGGIVLDIDDEVVGEYEAEGTLA